MKGLDDAVTSLSLHSVTRSRRRPPSSTDSSTVMLSQSSVLNDSNASRQEQRLLGLSIPVEQYEGIKVAIAQHLQYAPNKAFNGVKLVFEFGTQVHFNVQTLNKLQKFVHTRSELSRFGCLARFCNLIRHAHNMLISPDFLTMAKREP